MQEETLNWVLARLSAAGGTLTYRQLYEAIDFQNRSYLPDALRMGKARGVLRRENPVDEKTRTVSNNIVKVA